MPQLETYGIILLGVVMAIEKNDLESYSKLLDKAREIIIPYEQEWQKSGKYFNFFEALGIERKEVRHSALLATLLNPKALHGMEDRFLKLFVEKIGFDSFCTKNAIVRTEEVIKGGRRLDISIVSADWKQKIVIENKIDTDDHDNQLNAYLADLKKQYDSTSYRLIYLTLNGDFPYEEINESEIICLSYREDILHLMEKISLSKNNLPNPILEIIRQYTITIQNITNQGVDKEMDKKMMELLVTDNNYELADRMYKQLSEIKIEVLTHFIELLLGKFHSSDISVKYKSETNYKNAVARYAVSTADNESEYLQLGFSLQNNKRFFITFEPAGWFWNEIKNNDNSEDKTTTEEFWARGKEFDKINFRFPNTGFMKFARMSEKEQEEYISNYVDDIECRLREMNL